MVSLGLAAGVVIWKTDFLTPETWFYIEKVEKETSINHRWFLSL